MKIMKLFVVIASITAMLVSSLMAETGEGVSPVGSLSSITTGISNDVINPERFELFDTYPNPFNPETNIKYNLPKASFVTITVYNALGQTVTTLVNKTKKAGLHVTTFNGTNLSSGIYYYLIQAGSFNQVKKMVLMK